MRGAAGRLLPGARPSASLPRLLPAGWRHTSTTGGTRIVAPPMVFITGEEMTRYCMDLILKQWVEPHIDHSAWEFYDLSCANRDRTEDKVLHDAVAAGRRLGSIFKEPTVTPTEIQKEKLGLKKAWGSPNGAMRRGWNGITISRDTIHIEGMPLGYRKPVLFDRQAVGGEYGAGYKYVGKGRLVTLFLPEKGATPTIVDGRILLDEANAVVSYDNPLDNVVDMAHHFFKRCLEAHVVPYVVTKKTVFKWQEGFWIRMKNTFDAHYREAYRAAGLLDRCGGELQHLISDAATMQIIRWTDGGFGMAAHNYDGDMLTDEVAQVHRSPGFITSNLIGKNDDGTPIKEFEASHGTVADMWDAHLQGRETSLNPLGLVEALIGAMDYAAELRGQTDTIVPWTANLRSCIHKAMVSGRGTRDLCGPSGATTEQFVDTIARALRGQVIWHAPPVQAESHPVADSPDTDLNPIIEMFESLDENGDGHVNLEEFVKGLRRLGVSPRKYGFKGGLGGDKDAELVTPAL